LATQSFVAFCVSEITGTENIITSKNSSRLNENYLFQDISTMQSGTKARGVPVCWLIIAEHLEETFHRQNIAVSHPQLLFL